MARAAAERKGRRVVMFPCPLQGHINPMLQLATLLHSKGLSITIIHTKYNSPNASNYPDFNFEPISDGTDDPQASTKDVIALLVAINTKCVTPFQDCLARLLSESTEEPISCLISDANMSFTQSVNDQLKLPRMVLRTSSASSFVPFSYFPLLQRKGYLPIQESESNTLIPELPPLRVMDLPLIDTKDAADLYKLVGNMINETRASTGLILNSLECVEGAALKQIRKEFPIPNFPIGPLHKQSPDSSNSLLIQDRSCMDWLEKQKPRSVLYVSFGSIAAIDKMQLVETAWGLANSEQPFLWVVRPGLVCDLELLKLPKGFEEKTRQRGWVVNWAPQQEVLAHPTMGGFWTHCGWNSTLESISEGVPMLCWPFMGDQRVNARFMSHIWRIGIQLENGLERGEIEKAIRKLIVEKEGEEIRDRIKLLKQNVEHSLREGGSSHDALEALIDYILSL